MEQLSFKWPHKFFKTFAVITSWLTSAVILAYLIYYLSNYHVSGANTILGLIFITLYCIFSAFFGSLLARSKRVLTSDSNLVVGEKKDVPKKIPVSCILKIERRMYFFYSLSLSSQCHYGKEIIVFISTNPNLTMSAEFKHLKQLITENNES